MNEENKNAEKEESRWPQVVAPSGAGDDVDRAWHVAINNHANSQLADGAPWPSWMYQTKTAAREVPRLALLHRMERLGKLAKTFQKCSCCTEKRHVVDNHLTCCLGTECRKCPHLAALDSATVTDDERDWLKAWTCVGHILSSGGDRAGEGFIVTEDDKMFWSGVYESLASVPE